MFMVVKGEKNFENDRSPVSKDGEYTFKLKCHTPMADLDVKAHWRRNKIHGKL